MAQVQYRHHKHPDSLYTVFGTGIIAAITKRPINDMDSVSIYADSRGHLYVCNQIGRGDGSRRPAGYVPVTDTGRAQARVPLKIGDLITVYRSVADDKYWVRSTSEFEDGRFTKVE